MNEFTTTEPYRVGFSTVDITPPIGMNVRLGGYLRIWKTVKQVYEPLFARAICFRHPSDPSKSILIMSVDLVGFQYRMAKIARRVISNITGIPIAQIMMHFTHGHTSPDMIGIFPNSISHMVNTDVQYPVLRHILRQLVHAGKTAYTSATVKCKIGFGVSKTPTKPFAVQRRPPYEQFLDPFRIIKITDEQNKILAVLVNYQGHPTQLPQSNSNIYPEYPGAIAKALSTKIPGLQYGAYFNGAIGDVSIAGYRGYHHAINTGKTHEDAMHFAIENIQKMGNDIVDYVIEALPQISTSPLTYIAASRRFLLPKVGRIRPIRDRMKFYHGLKSKLFLLWKEFKNALRVGALLYGYEIMNGRPLAMLNVRRTKMGTVHQTELYVFKLNDIIWFSSPGEPFSIYQKKLFAKVPQQKAFMNCMANDTCGYIFPWSFHVQEGYETSFSFDMLFGEYLYKTFSQELAKLLSK